MIGGGSWCPSRDEVNRIRLHIWKNWDERKEITENQTFRKYYGEVALAGTDTYRAEHLRERRPRHSRSP